VVTQPYPDSRWPPQKGRPMRGKPLRATPSAPCRASRTYTTSRDINTWAAANPAYKPSARPAALRAEWVRLTLTSFLLIGTPEGGRSACQLWSFFVRGATHPRPCASQDNATLCTPEPRDTACRRQFSHDGLGRGDDATRHDGPSIRTAYGFAGLVSGDSEFQPCGLKDGTERSDGWVATG
jgi:hypothetical protein